MKIIFLILLALLSITSAFAQQRKYNPSTRSFETTATTKQQPQIEEAPVSKKQVIIGAAATAGILICEQFRKCNYVLNTIRNVLVPYQTNSAPVQYFNRPAQRSNAPLVYQLRGNYRFPF